MHIDNIKLANLFDKFADYVENVEKEKREQKSQDQLIVKESEEKKQATLDKQAEKMQAILSELLGEEIQKEAALKIVDSELGNKILDKLSTGAPDEMFTVDEKTSKSHRKGAHWDSFLRELDAGL